MKSLKSSQARHTRDVEYTNLSASRRDRKEETTVKKQFDKAGFASGRAWGGRAELRHHNLVLKVVTFLLACLLVYQNYSWRQHSDRLADGQWLVFHDRGGATSVATAEEFRTGPSDEEIHNRAWEVLKWILGAGSNNVDTSYGEARKMMTADMQQEFDSVLGRRREQLKELHIHRRIENAQVRPLAEEDLPSESRVRPSRYDVVVTGTLDTYRLDTNERLATGPFAYHIRLVPLERRTTENPYGLLVAGLSEIKLQQKEGTTDRKSTSEGIKKELEKK
jgi:hypothetical protein